MKGPVTAPKTYAAPLDILSTSCAFINCPVPKAPAAISITPAAYPDPGVVTVIPVIVGAVVPVTSTVAIALFTEPCVKVTFVY